ncbi:MAG: PRC-barrel domain containing protein [Candidatus Omnitrophica bacterium]|nr:PRC-barrel domain containing protein [Candidatus Omnitrophota bacterium]
MAMVALRSVNEVIGYNINALDGEIGKITDLYFDDTQWIVQYFVVDTGSWLSGRSVLISPVTVAGEPDWRKQEVSLLLNREMVEKSPDIDTEKPVSRQKELEIMKYYRWPVYWGEPFNGPVGDIPAEYYEKQLIPEEEEGQSHLRSVKEVEGYRIHARDGEIGHVKDFIAEDAQWNLRYLIADTGTWLPGRKVLIDPLWLESVDWSMKEVKVTLSREEIKNSPPYDPSEPINRDYEGKLYDYYGRPEYWK